jgi:Prenyltransferase and squalene oxidase repeat
MPYRPAQALRGFLAITMIAAAALGADATRSLALPGPNLVTGSAYLSAPANLIDGHYYESFPGYADFGLTIDGAFALAATGDDDLALKGIVEFLDSGGQDPHGYTVNTWTGIGTRYAAGGSIGDEALLAEVTGYNPHDFGGHDLIAALDASVCARASASSNTSCAGAGNYTYATSVFDQALGIIAQLRAGQASQAAAPIQYLESLRNADGSFPSLIPDSHDQDVDSTAMAVMALALVPGSAATADVESAAAWIAGRQEADGGFPGASGDSVNSAGLAIQALTLEGSRYQPQIDAALGFLAAEQNADGGFNVDAGGQRGSDVRASAQALGGAVGTSFGTLQRNLSSSSPPPPPPTPTPTPTQAPTPRPSRTPAQQTGAVQAVSATPAPGVPAPPRPPPAPARIPAASSPQPSGLPRSQRERTLADVGDDSSLNTDLWWAVAGVAVAAAVVIGLLFVRRRRLYPVTGKQA